MALHRFVEDRYCWDCAEYLTPEQTECPFCDEPTITASDAEERAHFDRYDGESEPPLTATEMLNSAWAERQALRTGIAR